ncbi:OsmC family protein [Nakamurella leprariae]|uniref:OsmC family protein n=1 Tax=Nakamurella leprariae TaxID=2803911 RepID=A0A939BY48_9ACTN|nr:OsmC family protein [Nakamurella leprariae]MBM9466705.1 OsmC family protein [Nakamurella leprariae]
MTTLNEYLAQKRDAILTRRAAAERGEGRGPHQLRAETTAEGRSGVRRIRIRDFQIIMDSGPDFAGYDLGPSSPELQLGVLSSCLTHIYLIQAADRQVPLDSLRVEVTGTMHPQAGQAGLEDVPIYPHQLHYTVHLESPASEEELRDLHEAVERNCPIFNLLREPQQVTGTVINHAAARETVDVAV